MPEHRKSESLGIENIVSLFPGNAVVNRHSEQTKDLSSFLREMLIPFVLYISIEMLDYITG